MEALVLEHETAAGGDTLDGLFREHWRRLFQAAFRVTGDAGDAEDACQTVFLRLARRGVEIDLSAGAATYLHRAAVRAALDRLRARRRARAVSLEALDTSPEDVAPGPERGSLSRELARHLRRALAELPERAAEIFALRYLEGMANRDIAHLLNMSPTAVAVALHRARHRLRDALSPLAGEAP